MRHEGMLRHIEIVVMPAPTASRADAAALHVMREQAKATHGREVLGARAQAHVRTVAAWLLRRCPA